MGRHFWIVAKSGEGFLFRHRLEIVQVTFLRKPALKEKKDCSAVSRFKYYCRENPFLMRFKQRHNSAKVISGRTTDPLTKQAQIQV